VHVQVEFSAAVVHLFEALLTFAAIKSKLPGHQELPSTSGVESVLSRYFGILKERRADLEE